MGVTVEAIGLANLKRYLVSLPDQTKTAARIAVNDTTRFSLPMAREAMLKQVAFPRGYLTDPTRLGIVQFASNDLLLARVVARDTPTSLARFVTTTASRALRKAGKGGVTVRVRPGVAVDLPRAFLLNLRNGNVGLAIRLKPGEALSHTVGAKLLTGRLKGVALLYGPSVNQVFGSVAEDISPELADYLETQFLRQFVRLTR